MDTLRIETAQHVDITYEAAGAGDRVIATLIDFLIQIAIVLLTMLALWMLPGAVPGLVWWGVLVIVTLYHPICETFMDGQSPGKRAMKTRVARIDGARADVGRYALRWLISLVEIWLTFGVAALIAVTVNRRGQRIGDMAAGTAVIRVRKDVSLHNSDSTTNELPEREVFFPEAAVLSPREVETIRSVVNQVRANGRNARTERLARRTKEVVEQKLGLSAVDEKPYRFLVQILSDYGATGSAATSPPSEAPPDRWQRPAPAPTSPAPTESADAPHPRTAASVRES